MYLKEYFKVDPWVALILLSNNSKMCFEVMGLNLLFEFEECFKTIRGFFDDETLKIFLESDYKELGRYQMGIGTCIRNQILNRDNEINILTQTLIGKADLSMLLIQLFYLYWHKIDDEKWCNKPPNMPEIPQNTPYMEDSKKVQISEKKLANTGLLCYYNQA